MINWRESYRMGRPQKTRFAYTHTHRIHAVRPFVLFPIVRYMMNRIESEWECKAVINITNGKCAKTIECKRDDGRYQSTVYRRFCLICSITLTCHKDIVNEFVASMPEAHAFAGCCHVAATILAGCSKSCYQSLGDTAESHLCQS